MTFSNDGKTDFIQGELLPWGFVVGERLNSNSNKDEWGFITKQ